MADRDPRRDPRPGDSLEHPVAGAFRTVRIVEMDRVYFRVIDVDGSTSSGSERLADWRQSMRQARVAHVEPEESTHG